MAICLRLLNWTVLRLSFRLVMSWEVKHRFRCTHTQKYTQRNGQALLFVYHTPAGTPTNPSAFTFRPTCHCIVMPTECLLAPVSRFLIACVLILNHMPMYIPLHICRRSSSIFLTFRQEVCFEPNVHPLFSSLLHVRMVAQMWQIRCCRLLCFHPSSWLWSCNPITHHQHILVIIHEAVLAPAFSIYSNSGSRIYTAQFNTELLHEPTINTRSIQEADVWQAACILYV